jgi:hypothetical protein
VIARLNPIITGWAAYYRIGVSKRAFGALDAHLRRLAWKWAKFSHPYKPRRWIIARYFGMVNPARQDKWVLGSRETGFYLRKFAWTKIVRHRMVAGRASPDDPALTGYWDQRRRRAAPGGPGEAVWWVTIVDATLVRHHLDAYDRVMADQTPEQRDLTEETLAGLRFVRNQIGDEADLAEFIEPSQPSQDPSAGRITGWTWKLVPQSKLASLTPHRRAWEMSRHQAYQAQLAGHTIGETFGRATTFLKLAVADAPTLTGASAQAGR